MIPLQSIPTPFHARNNKSSLNNATFVEEAIESLLTKGCISEVDEIPMCCNPLTVANKSSKLRLVLDLRHVNQYVQLDKFKYEDLTTFAEIFEEKDFFVTFDLTSGYHHIDIHPEQRKYLGFHWLFPNGQTKYFIFNVLPFGLSSACYIFTKILRPYVKKWRSKGIKSIIFIDDGICGSKTYRQTESIANTVVSDLRKGGWFVNFEKSRLIPTQKGKWLGTIIDTQNSTFYVPEEKINNLIKNINSVLAQTFCSAKQLSRVAGQLASMHLALGPIVRLLTRQLYKEIESQPSWHSPFQLPKEAADELNFWLENITERNGFTFKPRPTTTKVVFTDASSTGYGGFIAQRLSETLCVGKFNETEMSTGSTERELAAADYVLKSFGPLLSNESVQINLDNFGASRILSVGSSKMHLQKIAIQIFGHCIKYNISLHPRWVPRDLNGTADWLSKFKDTDDWSIDIKSYNSISRHYGPFTIDRFADNNNRKTLRFNSKFFCPETESVNAFTNNWQEENNFLCPPISLIGSTIRHLRLCKASGTLVIPVWPSAYFWPIIFPNGVISNFVTDFYVFEPIYNSPCKDSVFNGFAHFKTIALKIEF